MTLVELIASAAEDAPEQKVVVVLDGKGAEATLTYRELFARAARVAADLRDRGPAVAVATADPHDFLASFFGVLLAGHAVVPIAPHYGLSTDAAYARGVAAILRASGAAAAIADAHTARALASERLELLQADRAGAAGPPAPPARVGADDLALLQFTSGSTANPRGVALTHGAILANLRAVQRALEVDTERDVAVSWLPLFHDMGLIGMALGALHARLRCVLLPPLLFAKSPRTWLSSIARHRGTVSFAPSSAYGLVARRLRERDHHALDLSSWRIAGIGAEPIRSEHLEAFAAATRPVGFDARAFTPSYGLAEHAVAVTIGRGVRTAVVNRGSLEPGSHVERAGRRDPGAARLIACGHPLDPEHGVRIAGPPGACVVGEIEVRGPSLMRGYLEDGVVMNPGVEWLQTGDLGFIDERGELYVCGRLKEVIVKEGRKLHPSDVEGVLGEAAEGRPVVAFGTSPLLGPERIVVVVEAPASGPRAAAFANGLATALAERCGVMLDPRDVVFVAPRTLPRTTSGKLRRLETRALYEQGALAVSEARA